MSEVQLKKVYHHIGIRLEEADYLALEETRKFRGLRSLNATVADLIRDEAQYIKLRAQAAAEKA